MLGYGLVGPQPFTLSVRLLFNSVASVGKVSASKACDGSLKYDALGENRDAGALICAQQRGLDQLFGKIAIEGGVPSDGGFERQAVDLELLVGRAGRSAGGGIRVVWIRTR